MAMPNFHSKPPKWSEKKALSKYAPTVTLAHPKRFSTKKASVSADCVTSSNLRGKINMEGIGMTLSMTIWPYDIQKVRFG